MDNLLQEYWVFGRPPAPARGPAYASLVRRWIVFVVDHTGQARGCLTQTFLEHQPFFRKKLIWGEKPIALLAMTNRMQWPTSHPTAGLQHHQISP